MLGSASGVSDNEIMRSGRGENYGMSRGSTPTEYSVDWSRVWLDRLISAITAQLDWPDILPSFVRRITHSTKAPRRQLLLQQSFSILGRQRVWGAAVCSQDRGNIDATVCEIGSSLLWFILCKCSRGKKKKKEAFGAAAEDFALSSSSSSDTSAFSQVSSVIRLCYF